MKSVLVLYPIQPYVNELMFPVFSEIDIKYAKIYQRLISKRYSGFQLIWIMFSEPQSSNKPDMSQLWQGISIKKDDIVWSCGISFDKHCKKQLYPDSKTILDACPQPIEELVIGGFHFWDCVERVAKYAYEHGINVSVDDDLTEFFFYKVKNCKGIPSSSCIPLLREKSIKKDRKRFIEGGHNLLEHVREVRRRNPWLLQI